MTGVVTGTSFLARSRSVTIATVAVALLLAVLIVQTGIANVARYSAPEQTLRWAPGDARALAGASELVLTADAGPQQRVRAAGLARDAIRRDPTLGTPFRVLGFIAEANGDRANAKRLIEHAEQMSRRDLPTQLWLIDAAVAREDMTGALRHFDIALRTSMLAPAVLFPVLNKAISEPEVVDSLARTLAARPGWRDRFLADAIDKSPELDGLVRLAGQLRANRQPMDAAQTQQLLYRLTEGKAFAQVAMMRRFVLPAAMQAQEVIDPGFDVEGGMFPFVWTLFDKDGVWARRMPVGGSANALRLDFHADAGRGGVMVRQLLTLASGHYRLAWTGGHDAPGAATRPVWSIACGEDSRKTLLSADMPGGQGAQRGEGEFIVPSAGCNGQWLLLAARPGGDANGLNGWLDRVEIRPR